VSRAIRLAALLCREAPTVGASEEDRVRAIIVTLAFALCNTLAGSALALPVRIGGDSAQGHAISLDDYRGRVVAITLVSRYTRKELERVNAALVGEIGPDVTMMTVVDFIGIPRLFHGYARRKVAEGAAHTVVQFLVDDRGSWRMALDAAPDKRVDIIVLDREGELRGHFVGVSDIERARRLIRDLSTR
jgi:hypothetical protein